MDTVLTIKNAHIPVEKSTANLSSLTNGFKMAVGAGKASGCLDKRQSGDVFDKSGGIVMSFVKHDPAVEAYEAEIKILQETLEEACRKEDFDKVDKLNEMIEYTRNKIENINNPEDPDLKSYRAQSDECFNKMMESIENKDEASFDKYHEAWKTSNELLEKRRTEIQEGEAKKGNFIKDIIGKILDSIKVLLPAIFA